MNEEIIIDGVNVARCDYAITPKKQCPTKSMPYAKETSCIGCKEHNTKLNFCKNNSNCYFKQLKRLEKENEEWKEATEGLLKVQYALADSCKKYRSAFKEIKRMVKGHKIADEARLQVIKGLINKVLESEGE